MKNFEQCILIVELKDILKIRPRNQFYGPTACDYLLLELGAARLISLHSQRKDK